MNDYVNMDNVRFFLFEVEQMDSILKYPRYKDYDIASVNILLDSMKDWADKSFYPYYREMDVDPAKFVNGEIISHKQIAIAMREAGENGYLGACFNYENMGSQMPRILFSACSHIIQAANNHIPGYINLTGGAANLILAFGTKGLYERFVPLLLEGRWGGTMALTEPQAGSSLSDISTTATAQEDGAYSIRGQKIFISGGDYNGAENFVHMTLARIKGAPKGTKGISLFAIPKFRVEKDGYPADNDVITAGDFQKLGQRGYSTVHLVFGENNNCHGWLVGKPNEGLKYMFQMMNTARIDVGFTAASTATAAYYASLKYATERKQGRLIEEDGSKDVNKDQIPIINHPDVRRMLLFQKSVIEGFLALLFYCTALEDRITNEDDHKRNHLLLEILTPIAKSFPSEKGKEAIDNGLQILGGYGFCMDFPLQQYYRDVRITPIYEGTTGIQGLDLLGRKIPMENGAAMKVLNEEINKTISEAKAMPEIRNYAVQLEAALLELIKIIQHLLVFEKEKKYNTYLSDATIFMEMMGLVIVGWQWLRMAMKSYKLMGTDKANFSENFYQSKINTFKYFYKYQLNLVSGFKEILLSEDKLTVGEEVNDLIN